MHRSLQRDHRRGADRSRTARPRQPAAAEGHLRRPQRLRRLTGGSKAHARRRRLQPLQARPDGAGRLGRRAPEVEHPPPRADGLRQDAPRADATALTEAGYVGEDVENILLKLIQAADFDIKKAETGIIYIDEVDKIAR